MIAKEEKEEINIIIEAIEDYTAMWDIPIEGSEAEEFADAILTKLKKNEKKGIKTIKLGLDDMPDGIKSK